MYHRPRLTRGKSGEIGPRAGFKRTKNRKLYTRVQYQIRLARWQTNPAEVTRLAEGDTTPWVYQVYKFHSLPKGIV